MPLSSTEGTKYPAQSGSPPHQTGSSAGPPQGEMRGGVQEPAPPCGGSRLGRTTGEMSTWVARPLGPGWVSLPV